MRLLRMTLVLGLVVAASACGDDVSTTTTVEPTVATTTPATTPDSTQTTQATTPPTTAAPTTEPPASPTTPQTTEPTPEPTTPQTTEPTPEPTPPQTTEPTPEQTTTTTELPAVTTTEPPMLDVKVYFVRGERLAIAHRQVPGPAILRGALTQLLDGPTAAERAAGYATTIPAGTSLLDLNLAGGTATVDLSDDYDDGGGSLMMMARVAQVVFTATQFDNSDQVVFWMDGEPIDYLGGEGIELAGPQSRSSTERSLTGGILIDTPDPGATVTSPFTVNGEGDVFEGDFPIVIRRNDVDVAGPFNVFAGAWGNWADFETTITLDLTPGPIELVTWDQTGCGPPECPVPTEIVVPLTLA